MRTAPATMDERRHERQPACKPGSVWPGLSPRRDGHSSGTPVAGRLKQPTRATGPTERPRGVEPAHRSYSVLLPAGLAMPPTLPPARCALTAPFHPCPRRPFGRGAVCFLWRFPWGRPRRTLSGAVSVWSPDFPPFRRRRPSGRLAAGGIGGAGGGGQAKRGGGSARGIRRVQRRGTEAIPSFRACMRSSFIADSSGLMGLSPPRGRLACFAARRLASAAHFFEDRSNGRSFPMKKMLALSLALAAAFRSRPARRRSRQNALVGGALGAGAGALIGSAVRAEARAATLAGAAIGAASGALIGSAATPPPQGAMRALGLRLLRPPASAPPIIDPAFHDPAKERSQRLIDENDCRPSALALAAAVSLSACQTPAADERPRGRRARRAARARLSVRRCRAAAPGGTIAGAAIGAGTGALVGSSLTPQPPACARDGATTTTATRSASPTTEFRRALKSAAGRFATRAPFRPDSPRGVPTNDEENNRRRAGAGGALSLSACYTPQQQNGTFVGGALGAGTGALIGSAVSGGAPGGAGRRGDRRDQRRADRQRGHGAAHIACATATTPTATASASLGPPTEAPSERARRKLSPW